jgi:hypothetical protein
MTRQAPSLLSSFHHIRRALGALGCLVGFGLGACEPAPGGDACTLADTHNACPECADGITTCSYGGVSVTEVSCQECQARGALFRALCEGGNTDSAAEIEADTVCTTEPL